MRVLFLLFAVIVRGPCCGVGPILSGIFRLLLLVDAVACAWGGKQSLGHCLLNNRSGASAFSYIEYTVCIGGGTTKKCTWGGRAKHKAGPS